MEIDSAYGRIPEILVLLLAAILLFYNLGANSLHSKNEAGHALVAREMQETGEWLTLRYGGEPYFKKGPLKFWLTALTYKVFGINEWTARIWSAIFAFGTVVLLILGGNALFGPRCGTIAALVVVTSHQYLYKHCARTGELDSALIFFFTAAMLLLLLAIERKSPRLLYLSFLAIGLSGLIKHLAIIPELLLIVVLFLTLTRSWKVFPGRTWLLSCGVAILVVFPWTFHQLWLYGSRFPAIHFGRELVQRATEGLPGSQQSALGSWFYPVTFKNGMFPWSLLLPFALWRSFHGVSGSIRRANLLLTVWIAVVFAIPMFSTGQAFRYILPAFPAVALLVGQLLNRLDHRPLDSFAYASTGIATLIAWLSTTNAAQLNPFKANQKHKMLEVDLLDRVDGAWNQPATWVSIVVMVVLAWILWRHRSRRWARLSVAALLAGVALFQVAPGLRFSTTTIAIHRAVAATQQSREQDEMVWTVLSSRHFESTTDHFYLRQLEPRVTNLKPNPRSVERRAQATTKSLLMLTTPKFARTLENQAWISNSASLTRLFESGSLVVLRISPDTRRPQDQAGSA